jgi:CTP synthase (UTP-ammonia lyase)
MARIAIVGDLDLQKETHRATTAALGHVTDDLEIEWIASDSVGDPEISLSAYDGISLAPGGPYRDMDGALASVRLARERGMPFIGACSGFQHAVIGFARNVLRLQDAVHAEIDPHAAEPVIAPLACSLTGLTEKVEIVAGTLADRLYCTTAAVERFYCKYGLSSKYEPLLEDHGLRVSGRDAEGHARILELDDHPFFLIALFVPQMRSSPREPHPLVRGFIEAAVASRIAR